MRTAALPSTSAAVAQSVARATTATTLTSSAATTTFGQTITFTVAVTSPDGALPAGSVALYDGTAGIGSCILPGTGTNTCTLVTSTLLSGTHSITAVFADTANHVGSSSTARSQTVRASTSTVVASSSASVPYGQAVQFTMTVNSADGSVATGTITLSDGTVGLGTCALTNGRCSILAPSLAGGSHSIVARYGGDSFHLTSTSPAFTQTVTPAFTTTAVVSSSPTSSYGAPVTFTISVASPDGAIPSGTVSLSEGSSTLGSCSLTGSDPNSCDITITSFAAGSHSLTARHLASANFAASSGSVVQTVNRATTTLALSSTGLSVVSTGVAVRLLPVDKVEPEAPTVKDGRYPLRRPILLLSKKDANPLVEAFAQFALSAPGQAIIAETYVPMPGH